MMKEILLIAILIIIIVITGKNKNNINNGDKANDEGTGLFFLTN